jgi:hypothetical protein
MTFEPTPGKSCSEVLEEANADRLDGRYAESLEKFKWFFENSRNVRGMGGVRLSFALGYWLQLADIYEPALSAITSLRDKTEERCRITPGDFITFHELSALNHYLNYDDNTVSVFVDVANTDKIAAKVLFHIAEPLLVARGMYHQCGPFLDANRTIDTNISAYWIRKKHEESFEGKRHAPPPLADKMFREKMTRLVVLLVLNDRESDAKLVLNRSLEAIDSMEFRSDLEAALLGHLPNK